MPMSPHRLALAGTLAAVIAVISVTAAFAASTGNQSASPTNPIAATALKYDGTWQGECWVFAKKVVFEATGREMGFDYRQGYLDAGAVEVSVAEAVAGDIIQIADDSNTKPDADYLGLHTFIVTENLGNGVFNGVDSNQKLDGVVHKRDAYDPAAMAARYSNLNYHIYRFPVPGGVPASGNVASAPAHALVAGERAIVSADGVGLNLRSTPEIPAIDPIANRQTVIPDGTIVTVTSKTPVTANGIVWVYVSSPQGQGWVASQYLRTAVTTAQSSGKSAPLMRYRSHIAFVTNESN
jgi:hypothetical protein